MAYYLKVFRYLNIIVHKTSKQTQNIQVATVRIDCIQLWQGFWKLELAKCTDTEHGYKKNTDWILTGKIQSVINRLLKYNLYG